MKKNDNVYAEIEDYGCNAEGVAKVDGKVIFIPFTIKGEKVETVIVNDKNSFFIGKAKNILNKSEHRVEPKCPYYKKCGGCQLQHIDYDESLLIKTKMVQDAIDKISKLNKAVLFCKPSNISYGYRNKLALPFDYETRKVGVFAPRSHRVIPIDDCPIQQSFCAKLLKITNEFVSKFQIPVYNEVTKTGLLKHLVARAYNNTILVTVVVNGESLPNYEEYFSYLLAEFENVGLSININTLNNNVILADKFVWLCGKKFIDIEENGIKYQIDNASFMQVNNYIKNEIYNYVIKQVEGFDLVVDAYSGAGLLTAMMSKTVKRAIGIEIVADAVCSANKLIEENGIKNVVNICGDSCKEIEKLAEVIKSNNACVVLDPPRKGCDKKLLENLLLSKPKKIVYISCNPSTLARDLDVLSELGVFDVVKIQPFDMFPQTKHVETVVVLKLVQ